MNHIPKFYQYDRYLAVYAHPDDETYTCVSLQNLLKQGKSVDVVYVTSGDYQGAELGPIREKEVLASMSLIGVPENQVHFLRIPERELMAKVPVVKRLLQERVKYLKAECVLSHDFEGGHNGHDAVSFCASAAASGVAAALFVFPAYHGWPEQRQYNQFVDTSVESETYELSPEEVRLKQGVIACHTTQARFFQLIQESNSAPFLFGRETLRFVATPIDYTNPPTTPVGYEFPGSKIRFEDFQKSIAQALV